MTATTVFMYVGFLLAAYSIVANDAIQTLGTFLSSNAKRPWWVLWIFACTLLVGVMIYGWIANHGDVSYGRLDRFPQPEGGVSWLHAIPPLCILFLTRYGVPVSTTFLVLTVFAPGNLTSMLTKSLLGYAVAFCIGVLVYLTVSRVVERRFLESTYDQPPPHWVALQWASTGFLWTQWLMHDLANIFVYLPRELNVAYLVFAVVVMLILHAVIFYRRGGAIQKIVTSKTNTTDIRSATIIDFIYGLVLLVFKEMSNIPMSTTWVFLGLLAGRELAMVLRLRHRGMTDASKVVMRDGAKAALGLAVSIGLAFGLPAAQRAMVSATSSPSASQASPAEPRVQPAAATVDAPAPAREEDVSKTPEASASSAAVAEVGR